MENGQSRRPERGWKKPLWERQEGETSTAFEAFAAYRDLGPGRSAAKVGEILGKSTRGTLEPWSSAWGWVERAGAWDDEADRNRRKRDAAEAAQARKKMLDDHAKAGRALVQIGAAALRKFDAGADEAAARRNIDALSAGDAARLLEAGAKMERLARGESSERVEFKEAEAFVDGLVELCLAYLPLESHEAFLADVDAKLGMGAAV